MKISYLTKKEGRPGRSLQSASDAIRHKLVFSSEVVLWILLLVVAGIELYVIYTGIYKNLTFEEIDPSALQSPTRVNFANYDRVIDRLEEVEDFAPGSFIDFAGVNPETGRNNPFSDPE